MDFRTNLESKGDLFTNGKQKINSQSLFKTTILAHKNHSEGFLVTRSQD